MALGRERKQAIVEQLAKIVSKSTSIIAAEYKGLKSSEMTKLRASMRKISGTHLKIVRNTLAKKAMSGTNYDVLSKRLSGPVLLVLSENDVGSTARLLRDFVKEQEKLSVIVLSIDGQLLEGNQLGVIANLPTKQEAIAKLATVIQAPVVKFVKTLAEPTAKLVRTFTAVCNTK